MRYHYNLETRKMGICKAIKTCRFETHVEGNKQQAEAFLEEKLRELYEPYGNPVRGVAKISNALKQYSFYPTQEERDALAVYVRNGYGSINRILQGKPGKEEFKTHIKNLDSLLANAPTAKASIQVYRTSNSTMGEELAVGKRFLVKTFVSTSADEKYPTKAYRPKKITWTLVVPPTVKSIDINALGESNMTHEAEILLERNTIFEVVALEENPGSMNVKILVWPSS